MRTARIALTGLALLTVIACADPAVPGVGTVPTVGQNAEPDTVGLPVLLAKRLRAAGLEARALDREGDAYALAEIVSDSGAFLVQWADMGDVVVEQVLGPMEPGGTKDSHFYPGDTPSPAFRLLDPAEVVRQSEASGALAILNGAFFETPGRLSTQLAFPVARRGKVVTGGSSPYGPGQPGAETARWGQALRALAVGDSVAHVAAYDPATGMPLDRSAFAEAVVSYAPEAHPSRIATRFQVLGALDADGDGVTETLLFATSDGQTTITAPVSLLSRLGVAHEAQVALDGGASVFVWNRRTGMLQQPAPAGGHDPQRLPHYFILRLR